MIEMEQDIYPPLNQENINQIFISITTVDKKDWTIYIYNKGHSPSEALKDTLPPSSCTIGRQIKS